MTEKQLSQYRSLKAEIKELTSQIKTLDSSDIVNGSDPVYPYIQHNIKVTGTDGLAEARDRLRQRCREYDAERAEILAFVDGIEDSETRRIFRYRYIDGDRRPSWLQIAFKLGKSDEGTPRKKHDKFLRHSEFSEFPML